MERKDLQEVLQMQVPGTIDKCLLLCLCLQALLLYPYQAAFLSHTFICSSEACSAL